MPLALIETEHLTSDHVAKVTHHELEGVQPAQSSSWQVNSNLCIMYVVHLGFEPRHSSPRVCTFLVLMSLLIGFIFNPSTPVLVLFVSFVSLCCLEFKLLNSSFHSFYV